MIRTMRFELNTATTLKLFAIGALVVIAVLCSLAVFGMQQDRLAREQLRSHQCGYLTGAVQTVRKNESSQPTLTTDAPVSAGAASRVAYLNYLEQQLQMHACAG